MRTALPRAAAVAKNATRTEMRRCRCFGLVSTTKGRVLSIVFAQETILEFFGSYYFDVGLSPRSPFPPTPRQLLASRRESYLKIM